MVAAYLLILLTSTFLSLLVNAQLTLLSSRSRPFSFTFEDDDAPPSERSMESNIAAMFRAAAYGTSTLNTMSTTDSTTSSTTHSTVSAISTEVTSSPVHITTSTETTSIIMSSTIMDTDFQVSNGVNTKDSQHEQDVIEMKSIISMEENYRRQQNQEKYKSDLSSKVVTTEKNVIDTQNINNKQLKMLNVPNSSE
ncbi:unnamed protein product, partial [Meganyctiphanes norvegica]